MSYASRTSEYNRSKAPDGKFRRLTPAERKEIVRLYFADSRITQRELADRYGVSVPCISQTIKRMTPR